MTVYSKDAIFLWLVLALCTASGVLAWRHLSYQADLVGSLSSNSPDFQVFSLHQTRFGDDTKDAALAVSADDILALDALEDLVIDLRLSPGVRDVFSLLSLPGSYAAAGEIPTAQAATTTLPEQRLSAVHDREPPFDGLLSADGRLTLVTVMPEPDLDTESLDRILTQVISSAPDTLRITRVGVPRLEQEIMSALARDQQIITPAAILSSLILVTLLFRSWRATIVCGLPVISGLALFFGGLAASQTALTPLVSLVPVILLVLGFSDSVHYFHAIKRKLSLHDTASSVALARPEILPALIGTSLTTIMAFVAMVLVDAPALTELAVVGSLGMLLMLVVVATMVPVLARLLLSHDMSVHAPSGFAVVTRGAERALGHWRMTTILSMVMLATLLIAQTFARSGHDPREHIPRQSTFLADLETVEQHLPGSGRLHVMVEAANASPGLQEDDRRVVSRALAALSGQEQTGVLTEGADTPYANRFASADGSAYSIPVPISLLADPETLHERVEDIETRLEIAALADVTSVTGYALMAARSVPELVDALKRAFYLTILVMTVATVLVLRSISLGLVSLVPNLLPILGVEAWIALQDQTLTLTGAIALVIAFGIAVDNTIHLLNRFRIERGIGGASHDMASRTLHALISPIMTTCLLLLVGFLLTVFSALPAVSLFGMLTALAIFLAFLSDVFLFPGLLIFLIESRPRKRAA